MKSAHFSRLLIILMILSLAACKPKDKNAKNGMKEAPYQSGMLFEKTDKLAGIPLASTPAGGNELPPSVDLSGSMPAVGNQGNQQSCVAWSVAYALKSYQEKVETGQQDLFSPSFIYNQINNGINAPTYITDALNLLSQQGVCPLNEMPYNESDWTSKPSDQAKTDAKKFRIDFWRQVNVQDVKEVKAQLAAGYPVVIGAQISQEFMFGGKEKKAAYIWDAPGTPAGGHAMVLVGYDDNKNAFKLMNSWGADWGDNGFSWVTYDNFSKVVMYGFVAKDAVTDVAEKSTQENKKPTEDTYNPPEQNPTQYLDLDFKASNVQHNVGFPDEPNLGYCMKIDGSLNIPAGYGKKFQIAVHVYDANTNQQVGSLNYPRFSDVNGYASGFTPVYDVSEEGFRGTWWVYIPYSAVNTQVGATTNLYAIPTLFIDNFGVAKGDRIDFYIRK